MSKDEKTPETSAAEATEPRPRHRRRRIAAAVVAGALLVAASSFAGSMAGAGMAGEKGPPADAVQTMPDGPPAGFGS